MLSILKKDFPGIGSVLFRGSPPPRAEDFASLASRGFELEPLPRPGPDLQWGLRVRHADWGEAEVVCLRDAPPPPAILIEHDTSLSDEEKREAAAGRSAITVRTPATQKNVLRDRKRLLRYLRAIMGDEGVVAIDHASERFWSRAAMDDELAHDADLDIEAVYSLHAVRAEGSEQVAWLHTHGLATLGAFDFDILSPAEDALQADVARAIAFAVVEGSVRPSTRSFDLAFPGGRVGFVPVADFHRAAPAAECALRFNDESHSQNRAVLCDPSGGWRGLFGRQVRLSRFLSRPMAEHTVLRFSNAATELMAARARGTVGVFRALAEEFAGFEFPALAKIGYRVDGGGENDYEHLWFQVHEFQDGAVDATLVNQPHRVAEQGRPRRALPRSADGLDHHIAGRPGHAPQPGRRQAAARAQGHAAPAHARGRRARGGVAGPRTGAASPNHGGPRSARSASGRIRPTYDRAFGPVARPRSASLRHLACPP